MMLALARFGGQPAVVLGQQRVVGGLVGPAALQEARRGMALAAGLQLPLVLVIDTAGPALATEAEQGGLAGEIARCLAELVTLDTPTVSVLLGQGSGGPALAMVPADRVLAAAFPLIMLAVIVFLVGLVSDQISALRFEGRQ